MTPPLPDFADLQPHPPPVAREEAPPEPEQPPRVVSKKMVGAFQAVRPMTEELKRNQFENDWKQVCRVPVCMRVNGRMMMGHWRTQIQIADAVRSLDKRLQIKEVRPPLSAR